MDPDNVHELTGWVDNVESMYEAKMRRFAKLASRIRNNTYQPGGAAALSLLEAFADRMADEYAAENGTRLYRFYAADKKGAAKEWLKEFEELHAADIRKMLATKGH